MKVVIIGASTSGLFTAYLLAKEGVEVEVYEKADTLGWPPRTVIVTKNISEVLDFEPEEAIVNKIRYLELFSKSRSARVELTAPDLVIERERLIKLLGCMTEEAGARIVLGHRFETLARIGRKIVVILKNLLTSDEQRVEADVLIGADGTRSAVSQAVSCDGHRFTTLIQARVPLPERVDPETVKVWFDSTKTKYFYWLIPESNQVAAIGLVEDDRERAEACLKTFLQERQLGICPDVQMAMAPVNPFKYADGVLMPSQKNIFVVGDAATHVKVTTVGGVVAGLTGAKALAKTILNGGNFQKEFRQLKFELITHSLVRNVLNRFREENYDELLDMLQGRLKEVLEKWTRDELRQIFLKLIWNEPRLIPLGMKAVLRSALWK